MEAWLLLFAAVAPGAAYGVGPRMHPPTLLIGPQHPLPCTHALEVKDSEHCFYWRSTNEAVVSVAAVGSACSRRAVVASRSREPTPVGVAVVATRLPAPAHLHGDRGEAAEEIRSIVLLSAPVSLELMMPTSQLYVTGSLVPLKVLAKDKFGNTFDSINGLRFEWNISQQSEQTVAKFVTSKESQWDKVLLQGVTEGECVVKVSYEKNEAEAKVRVSGNVVAVSAMNSGSDGRTIRMLHHTIAPIRFQSPDGSLLFDAAKFLLQKTFSDNILHIDEHKMEIHSLNYGSTRIIFKSIDAMLSDVVLNVNVVKPSHIRYEIPEGGKGTLQEQKSYSFCVSVYDKENHKIYSSDNMHFTMKFPSPMFHVNRTSSNGAHVTVQTLAPGSAEIYAAFNGVQIPDADELLLETPVEQVTKVSPVVICQKLEIRPQNILLPSTCNRTLQNIYLEVKGGTNNYLWTINKKDPAALLKEKNDNPYSANLQILKDGYYTVSVSDAKNPNFFASSQVTVSPIIEIDVFPTVVEAEIGNTLMVPTAFYGYNDEERKSTRKFDDCNAIKPTIKIVDNYVLEHLKEAFVPAFGKGCMTLQFRCKNAGHTRINIFDQISECTERNDTLMTTIILSCYKPLKALYPARVAVLAVGTSMEVAFEGGPRKWHAFKVGHYTTLQASNPELLDVNLIKDPYRYNKDMVVFRVFCKKLGENTLKFHIGNNASATNRHPAQAKSSVKIVCSEPASIHLRMTRSHSNKEPSLSKENVVKVPFYGPKMFSVDLWVKDKAGRKFSNISSLNVIWSFSDTTLISGKDYKGFQIMENAVSGYRKTISNFQEFTMSGGYGNLKISAYFDGYNRSYTELNGTSFPEESPTDNIAASITVELKNLRDMYVEKDI